MQIAERKSNDVTVFDVDGDIDINSSPDVRKTFEKPIGEKTAKLVINLSNVSYIDSSGLATLVELLKRARSYGGKIRLSNLAAKVKSLFEITKLEKLFDIYDTEEEAVSNFE
ncbi:MAG: STAS domain-containing protein [Candidatus Omnitrophica bacterium]|nr:STAS domain-containing protein [Candidatus Omnitrophota bacterium]